MINYLWPVALVVISNTVYQVCAKSVPGEMNPLASLVITYVVSAAACTILYFVLNKKTVPDLFTELSKTNWAPFLLGFVIIGLEIGFIYAYKAGWPVGTTQTVTSVMVAVLLILVGRMFYQENVTWNKVAGIIVCLGGLGLINWK